jgi:ATP-dependent Clp protease ATP-binding subunit ClpC
MPTYRVPILVWQDHEGFFTAVPVEPDLAEGAAAVAQTARRAMNQLKSYLDWLARQGQFPAPDFLDPQLTHVSVSVRPQYAQDGRVYLCGEMIDLRLPCVQGRRKDGLAVCALPTLGIRLYLHDREAIKRMIVERVREQLAGLTPMQLSRLLPPASVRLDQISVLQPRTGDREDGGEPVMLGRVAQAVGAPAFRKRFSTACQREGELEDLARRLSEEKASVVLVGEHGSGKTALLVGAVRGIERRARPPSDEDPERPPARRRRFWLTSAARLIAGMKYLGQWEQRCEQLVWELSEIDGVLCVESLIELLRLGGAGPGDSIASFFLPYLESGELRLVAEATPAELDACRRLLPGLVDIFQILRLHQMDLVQARAALAESTQALARDLKVTAEEQVPATICRLHQRFLPYQALPGGAAEFLRRMLEQTRGKQGQELTGADVIAGFLEQTGLPEWLLRDEMPLLADRVEEEFRRRIIGQPQACRTMAERIATFKAGLADASRPIGTLLFCGPTGVGKTELAKTVSHYLFGHGKDTDRLIRLDMSEYSAPWHADRVITKEDGTPSDFIARVRQQPFVVVLLDEIEKAASEVFDMLLGLLDEGRLTDRFGRTTNFRSAIVIMTSNLGASSRRSIGFTSEPADAYEAEVRAFFRPEFFNRLDGVITFRPLAPETCLAITRKELDEIAAREGFAKANLRLSYSQSLVRHFTQIGFDPRYGARPLQRVLETRVVATISRYLVDHPDTRDTEIRLGVDNDGEVTVAAGAIG